MPSMVGGNGRRLQRGTSFYIYLFISNQIIIKKKTLYTSIRSNRNYNKSIRKKKDKNYREKPTPKIKLERTCA